GGNWVQHARFDNQNRLMAAWGDGEGAPADPWAFAYDTAGERVLRYRVHNDTVPEAYFYLRDEAGNVLTRFSWHGSSDNWWLRTNWLYLGRDPLVRIEQTSSQPEYISLVTDHLGSTRAEVRRADTGNYTSINYLPYGELVAQPYELAEHHLFTGHERESIGSDLSTSPLGNVDYMHARYYSFDLRRFMSMDPLGGTVGLSQSWNRYSYVMNNPVNWLDPFGLAEADIEAALIAECTPYSIDVAGVVYTRHIQDAAAFQAFEDRTEFFTGASGGRSVPRFMLWGDDWLYQTTHGVAGFTDSVSFGLGERLRELTGNGGLVDRSSIAYRIGELTAFAISVSRLAYGVAVAARTTYLARFFPANPELVAQEAVEGRNALKTFFSAGLTPKSHWRTWEQLLIMKSGDLERIFLGSGKTNLYWNLYAAWVTGYTGNEVAKQGR
ncbi:MAG: RHS repeat-associated core domain-containing protein, partial [Acidobacteria bacterium]|nr:RHS repeat-associated core domain-containing protein [Acidobacteriota bacterium]